MAPLSSTNRHQTSRSGFLLPPGERGFIPYTLVMLSCVEEPDECATHTHQAITVGPYVLVSESVSQAVFLSAV